MRPLCRSELWTRESLTARDLRPVAAAGRRDVVAVAHLAQGRVADAELGGDAGQRPRPGVLEQRRAGDRLHVKVRSQADGAAIKPHRARGAQEIVLFLFSTYQLRCGMMRFLDQRPVTRTADKSGARIPVSI